MTDLNELDALIEKARSMGAQVVIEIDRAGWINGVAVVGIKGIGPFSMSPISFAEKMRAA